MEDTLLAAGTALAQIADPGRFLMLCAGVLMGLLFGVIPGLGGLVGMTLLLPFTFHMDPYTALAVLIGMHAVVATSDSIPAILFGVPGTVGSAATVLDGYPMSKRGESGRALGAAFGASMLGGIFGAVLLALSIPLIRPFMLSIGSPEMLAFCVFGLSLAAALSGKYMLRGLAMACLGLILSMVGEDYQSGSMRWTFDTLYLWEGIPLVPLALGLFAIPEIADLAVRRAAISKGGLINTSGQWRGFMDVLRNPAVFLRSSAIGSVLGALPGLGSAVIDWIAYGATARLRSKDADFGNGDVRGVIASEAANNAKEGGALVPTIAFGVPGSAAMAILLGAFLVQGIVPGPDMLSKGLDITYTLILSVAVANVIGAGLCFAFTPALARIAIVPIGFLAPIVLGITVIGAVQATHSWGDILVLLGAGAVGYLMRVLSWPRPPLLLGFVLGVLIERYLATSLQIFGASFLTRPVVMVMILITAWGILVPLWGPLMRRIRDPNLRIIPLGLRLRRDRLSLDALFAGVLVTVFVVMLIDMADWPLGARRVPEIVAMAGTLMLGAYLLLRLFGTDDAPSADGSKATAASEGVHMDLAVDREGMDRAEFIRRSGMYFVWIALLAALGFLIGLDAAVPIWIAAYGILGFGLRPIPAAVAGAIVGGMVYVVFNIVLRVNWPLPLLPIF